jgi:hypothetical protein
LKKWNILIILKGKLLVHSIMPHPDMKAREVKALGFKRLLEKNNQ